MEYYSDIKKKKMLPFAIVWIDLKNIMLSEISQSEKGKDHMISHTHTLFIRLIWNLMNKLN